MVSFKKPRWAAIQESEDVFSRGRGPLATTRYLPRYPSKPITIATRDTSVRPGLPYHRVKRAYPIALSGSIEAYYLHRYIDSNLMLLQEGKLECITPPQPGEQ